MPVCARCGRENPDQSSFCNSCGAAIVELPAAATEELKVVTVLFADITGSTALGERLDPEGLKEVTGAFFAAMRVEIEAEGGTVEKFIGDAIMAAFGVPRVHEDDPARALRAALRMRARLHELNTTLTEGYGVALELRMGVNTGSVMAVIDPRPGEALATGDAVNAAARLEQAAEPGQVLVAERTAQAARHFHFGPAKTFEVRGKAEPLHAVELVTEQPLTEGTLSSTRAPLVGRRRELDLLTATYRRTVEEGRPHLVTLYGEAGVGKSRLVGELLAGLEAADPAPSVLRGRCLAYGEGISYWSLAEILKAHARTLDSDTAEHAHARVFDAAEASLEAAGADDPAEVAELLTASIGLGRAGGAHRSAQELRAETQLAWRAFFTALTTSGPAVVVVEDLQWADAALLELLEDVAARAEGPLLLLTTARPELTTRRPTWGGGRRSFTGLGVEPLDAAASARLAALLLGADAPDREAIVARAEGNPFFLEEIVRTRGTGDELPDTVQAALAARVDLLPADEKRALQAAAVVGRVFWPGAVGEVAALESGAVAELLDRLQNRDLILSRLASSMSGQRELIFKHALIREVAYESLPRRDRVRMHRGVADWIEHAYAGRRAEVVELIAFHRAAAYRLGPSAELRAAAYESVAAAAEGAYARAVFERAVSLAREALDLAGAPLDRARALEVLGKASFVVFDGTTAWESLRDAADIIRAETPDDRARLAYDCGFAAMIPVRAQGLMRTQPALEEVEPYLRLGLESAGEEDSEALVMLLATQGYWEFGFGIDPADADGARAHRAVERAREIARRMERLDLELLTLDAMTCGVNARGLYGRAEGWDSERLEIARTIRDPFEVLDSFYTVAWSQYEVGRYREVLALYEEFEALGLSVESFGHMSLSVLSRVELGEWDEALAGQVRLREALGERASRPPSFASGGYGAEVLIQEARGDRGAADAVIAEIDAWDSSGISLRRWAVAPTAIAIARRGDADAASRLLDRLTDTDIYRPRELEARCVLVTEAADWDAAGALAAELREHAERGALLVLPFHADRLEGRARLAAGDPEDAVPLLERAAAGFASFDAAWQVAQTELALGEALAALERLDAAAAVLGRAAAVFERLRVARELAQARALLESSRTLRRP
ncbi:MAG TPA: adenylate/guanylate cyclase domain-containing protein [Solirubrobacteraceae bacterium]|nr:adenylate/guanylate cyclase domain-containing protein [Solirubrobacteraceae bacterium]